MHRVSTDLAQSKHRESTEFAQLAQSKHRVSTELTPSWGGGGNPTGFETNGEKNHIRFESNGGGEILLGLKAMGGGKSYWV